MRIWDISLPVEAQTAAFPGDTPFSAAWVLRLERGDSCNLSAITMSSHLGTHVDAPLHFQAGGEDVTAGDLRRYLGRCRVIDVRGAGQPSLVPAPALTPALLAGAERVLLRTRQRHDHRVFDPGFTALGPDAASVLASAGVLLVGIDTPSMDPAGSKDFAAHHVLREAGIAILESLDLSGVLPGDYELIALPLRIVGVEGSPVRAVLRELPGGRP